MPDKFEEQYREVLNNLEAAIASFYNEHPDISNSSVDRAFEALLRFYKADGTGKMIVIRLPETDQELYQAIKNTVEWRLGRGQPLPNTATLDFHLELKTVEEMLTCLKWLRKSANSLTKQSGRQGYLNYTRQLLS